MSIRQMIRCSTEEQVATLIIDNPPVNSLNVHTLSELDEAVDELLADRGVKAIVLTGGGKAAFVAGADITEIQNFVQFQDEIKAHEWVSRSKRLFDKIEAAEKPVIAAINGLALGGGLELAMACHIRLASERARLGQPEIDLGIIPAWGGTQRLARIVGPSKACWMILSGDPITAQEAKACGLVNRVLPEDELLREAQGLARKIAAKSGLVVAAAMAAIRAGLDASLPDGLAAEDRQFDCLFPSFDASEGLAAFLEKRPPQFQDR